MLQLEDGTVEKLIILEEYEPYLNWLKVRVNFQSFEPAFTP